MAQGVFEFLLFLGVDFSMSITLMLAIMAAVSGVFTVFVQYQKLEGLSGFGAMLPFTGFSAAIVEFTAAALDKGDKFVPAANKGLHAAYIIFGVGFPVAFIIAWIAQL